MSNQDAPKVPPVPVQDVFQPSAPIKAAQAAPVVPAAPVAPAAAPAFDPSLLQHYMQLLMAREARNAAKENEERQREDNRNAQRKRNSDSHRTNDLLKQAKCRHMKGVGKGPAPFKDDFAVYLHTYIDKRSVIRCFICGMKWRVEDTVEILTRNGHKIINHTKIGWREATQMLSRSTNTPSSSEIPLLVQTQTRPATPTSVEGLAVPDIEL